MESQGFPRSDICLLLPSQAELPFRAGDVITVFGNMDDDGFYYVRPSWEKKGVLYSGSPAGQAYGQAFLAEGWRNELDYFP